MTKKKKLVKEALKHPEQFSSGELAFFSRWLQERKARKRAVKESPEADSGKKTEP